MSAPRPVQHALEELRRRSPVIWRRGHDEFAELYRARFPTGHFYSPYPDVADLERRRAADAVDVDADPPGIDLRAGSQRLLFDAIAELAADLPFPAEPSDRFRYHLANESYAWSDGITLHALLRHVRPSRIVEVGSGYSSAMILDTCEGWLDTPDDPVRLRFVEPYPELLQGLLRPGDEARVTIDAVPVQDVPLAVFDELRSGDLLFIDSTHVSKAGSDVNHLFFEVLPRLAPGVWVHLHDIFMPFEYPMEWLREGRAWQEAYLLRAFLMFNTSFEVRWFQHYMWLKHQDEMVRRVPALANGLGGNIWLQRMR